MASVPTPESLKRLKVVELKEKLAQSGLSTSGLKADLIQRYHKHLVEFPDNQSLEALQTESKDEESEEDVEDVDERVFATDVDERGFKPQQPPQHQQQPQHQHAPQHHAPPLPPHILAQQQQQQQHQQPQPPPHPPHQMPQHHPPQQSPQHPPQMMPPHQQEKKEKGLDEDLQIKVAIQQQLLEQQKEAMARQQQQILQQQGPGGPPGPMVRPSQGPPTGSMVQPPQQTPPPLMAQPIQPPPGVRMPPPQQQQGDLMEKVRQQQIMLEVEQQNKMMQQQQQQQQQQQAINQAENERRMKEAELIRQQQIALMEAKREREDEQRKQQQQSPMQMGGPPQPPVQVSMQQNVPQQGPPNQMPPQMQQQQQQGPPMHPQQMGQPRMGHPPVSSNQNMMVQPHPQGMHPPQQQMGPSGPPNMPPQGMPHGMQGPPKSSGPQMVPPVSSQGPQPLMAQNVRPPRMMMQQGPPHGDGPRGPMPHGDGPRGPMPPGPQMMQQERMRGPPMDRPQEKLPPPQLDEPEEPREIKLPQALEKILAFKDVRAQEVGVSQEELEEMHQPTKEIEEDEDDIDEDIGYETFEMEEDTEKPEQQTTKETKNKRRKKKKKKAKKNRLMQQQQPTKTPEKGRHEENKVTVEYIQEQLELDPIDPNYHTFARIFEAFKIADVEKPKDDKKESKEDKKDETQVKTKGMTESGYEDDDDDDMDADDMPKDDDDGPKLSKKKLKKLTRLSVAQLKQLVSRPDVVEMHDVTAQDPRLLVHLKATRNTVPVPRHWCFKRKYLQGKRGIEKPPFELPEYIKATGIMEMREALAEKEDQKNMKAKMREKIRPKMGKIDIDYQKLHDAFFRWQVKPKMTIHGDLYYEGKEFETRLKEKKPGNLSDELRTALGMPLGPNSEKFPPPWLIAMQRYGPPPSYPNLKIPGLNAAIPETCSFGYHAGGWGKPPVDENGKPLYGDVFGTQSSDFQVPVQEEDLDKSHWGELEEESSEEEESEEESEGEEDDTGLITPGPEGLVTPSGITSVPMGVETPDMIELRKRRIEDAMDQGGETPALYTILPEKKSAVGGAMMGSAHIYDMTGVAAGKKVEGKVPTEGIEVALNPEELDLDTAAMQAKYDQTMREQQSQLEKEDLSDMVAEHAAKQKKRKKQQQDSGKAAKKYKEFKF